MAATCGLSTQKGRVINAERILTALDRRLDHEVSLVIYGRAAIALGFENPPEAVTKTLAVDAVIPDLAELREAFERAKPRVREMVRKAG